jgi:hypothetical protein
MAGSSTVAAAMESLPGDGLYPVKSALEQARLAMAVTDEDKAETYLWIASTRVDELARAVEAGRVDAVPKVVEHYEASVGQALTLAASSKDDVRLQQQVQSVQTSLREVYQKSPQVIDTAVGRPLGLSTGAPATVERPATSPVPQIAATPPTLPAGTGRGVDEPEQENPPVVAATPATGVPGTGLRDKGAPPSSPDTEPIKDGPLSTPPTVTVPDSESPPLKTGAISAPVPVASKEGAGSALPVEAAKTAPPAEPAPSPAPAAPSPVATPPVVTPPPSATPTPVAATPEPIPSKDPSPSPAPLEGSKEPVVSTQTPGKAPIVGQSVGTPDGSVAPGRIQSVPEKR